jgi:ABC-type dipeptide/oligopeptide/nickel transport system ATPase component
LHIIGRQIGESLRLHRAMTRKAELEAVRLLERVGIPSHSAWRPIHQLSGGMNQRMIAMALACLETDRDEPSTALDVTIRHRSLPERPADRVRHVGHRHPRSRVVGMPGASR